MAIIADTGVLADTGAIIEGPDIIVPPGGGGDPGGGGTPGVPGDPGDDGTGDGDNPVDPDFGGLTCQQLPDDGVLTLSGKTPNGNLLAIRSSWEAPDFLLRRGSRPITTGGFVLTDTEAPLGVPVTFTTNITSIPLAERVVQQNLMLTPTFDHGLFGWAAGNNRTLSAVEDPTSRTGTVGMASANASGTTPNAVPTLVGRVDSVYGVSGSFTLTPPTTGAAAIATNDWMALTHTQLDSVAAPATPTGWTQVADTVYGTRRQLIWTKKRVGGDTGYAVAAPSGASSVSSLLWVRGAIDEVLTTPPMPMPRAGLSTLTVTGRKAVLRPHLVVSLFSAIANATTSAPVGPTGITGASWQYTVASGTNAATLVVAASSDPDGGQTPTVTARFADTQRGGLGTQVIFQAAAALTNQVIAKGKAAALAAAPTQPYLLTGRARFTTPGLWTWQDVLDNGTWADLLSAKPTWQDVLGSASTAPGGEYLNLFVSIVDPATGANYVDPQLVRGLSQDVVNLWFDFSMLFTTTVAIPATAEIWFSHGGGTKEYPTAWFFDQLGITSGAYRAVHATRYWFSGDSAAPANSEDYLLPGGRWNAVTTDHSMVWSGVVGNSVSVFYGPSGVTSSITCGLDPPSTTPCEPVLLSDPVDTSRRFWAGLISIDDTNHPANLAVDKVIDREDAIATNTVRNWQESALTVQTDTLADRTMALRTLQKGKIVLLRNPDPRYPERDWYLAVGDVTEARVSSNHREPHRHWTIPFTRVARPSGDIDDYSQVTWADVEALGTWEQVQQVRGTWLGVATARYDT